MSWFKGGWMFGPLPAQATDHNPEEVTSGWPHLWLAPTILEGSWFPGAGQPSLPHPYHTFSSFAINITCLIVGITNLLTYVRKGISVYSDPSRHGDPCYRRTLANNRGTSLNLKSTIYKKDA
ncbi:hypothetical protein CEXT_489481 [Caerostris extrusa]|uniref:Uncharacterized protein n=1 Tax=Caerostris extrusa TaxID=172846 RepID=A0AAV4VDI9_CAEEX|nr:hypothetical protein CEXT_489481 [Caerostris extrusa]